MPGHFVLGFGACSFDRSLRQCESNTQAKEGAERLRRIAETPAISETGDQAREPMVLILCELLAQSDDLRMGHELPPVEVSDHVAEAFICDATIAG